MICLKFVSRSRGQALVEVALVTPLLVVFLFGVLWFASIVLTWQQLVSAARYGADILAYTPFSVKCIEDDIRDYLCARNTIGRTIDPKRLSIRIEANDYIPIKFDFDITNISSFVTLNSLNVFKSLKFFAPLATKKSFVEIKYFHKIPKILKIIGNDNVKITARASVLSGTGSIAALRRQK
jgi:hypothetical protein